MIINWHRKINKSLLMPTMTIHHGIGDMSLHHHNESLVYRHFHTLFHGRTDEARAKCATANQTGPNLMKEPRPQSSVSEETCPRKTKGWG
jgi:hypothetical protein